jgi:HEPN domain-containing protein
MRLTGVYLEDLCFDAQQAAEKSFKAIILARGLKIPHTHDLTKLLAVIEKTGLDIPEPIKPCTLLTDYAVITRYPSHLEAVTDEEYQELVSLAERAFIWSKDHITRWGGAEHTPPHDSCHSPG